MQVALSVVSIIKKSYSSCLTRTFFILRANSFLGIKTLCEHPSHLIRISIPNLIIFQRFVPHGWAFFISTTSFKANSFSSTLNSSYSAPTSFLDKPSRSCREYITSLGKGISIPCSSRHSLISFLSCLAINR